MLPDPRTWCKVLFALQMQIGFVCKLNLNCHPLGIYLGHFYLGFWELGSTLFCLSAKGFDMKLFIWGVEMESSSSQVTQEFPSKDQWKQSLLRGIIYSSVQNNLSGSLAAMNWKTIKNITRGFFKKNACSLMHFVVLRKGGSKLKISLSKCMQHRYKSLSFFFLFPVLFFLFLFSFFLFLFLLPFFFSFLFSFFPSLSFSFLFSFSFSF